MDDRFSGIIHRIMAELEMGMDVKPTFSHGTQQYENWVVECRIQAEERAQENILLACLALRELNTALLIYREHQVIM